MLSLYGLLIVHLCCFIRLFKHFLSLLNNIHKSSVFSYKPQDKMYFCGWEALVQCNHVYFKSGYLRVVVIYTSYAVRLKPRKIPPRLWWKKAKLLCSKCHICVFNTQTYYLTPKKKRVLYLQHNKLLSQYIPFVTGNKLDCILQKNL